LSSERTGPTNSPGLSSHNGRGAFWRVRGG